MRSYSATSELPVERRELWPQLVRPSGINGELRPLLRMTFPAGLDDVTGDWHPGRVQFRSWILLGGVLPVDYDDVAFVEVVPGHRFRERSTLLSQRVWEHDRTVVDTDGGCRVTDTIRFTPRWRLLAGFYAWFFACLFRWRHRQLRRRFGSRG